MNKSSFFKAILGTLLIFAATAFTACNDDDKAKEPETGGGEPVTPYIRVTPATLTFDHMGAAMDGDTFTVASNCAWGVGVEAGKEWVQLSATTGENSGSITVTISPAETSDQAEVTFITTDALGTPASQKVTVIRTAAPAPEPPAGDVTITADFQLGAAIATPELPPYTKDAAQFVTGRHEYTIGGYTFAIFADANEGGKFYWLDNTQFPGSIPEPNKCLYFSKLGAYIEFPALAGKKLSEVYYLPTGQQNAKIDLLDTDDADTVEYTLDFDDAGASQYALINSAANTPYRIEVTNTKNAQCAKLVLKYVDAE